MVRMRVIDFLGCMVFIGSWFWFMAQSRPPIPHSRDSRPETPEGKWLEFAADKKTADSDAEQAREHSFDFGDGPNRQRLKGGNVLALFTRAIQAEDRLKA